VVADETPPGPVTTWMIDPQATGAGTARPAAARRRYYVYVVELDDAVGPRRDPRYPSVYVGQSAVPPAERLRQHKDGYRSSRYVRKYGKHLRPKLYRHLNPMATRDQAVAMEQELARRLRNRGYTVYGGH
jgi:predicted GIY-YIG superfamily endonuclease